MSAHLHSQWGYDRPEILRNSIRQFGLIDADAGKMCKTPLAHHLMFGRCPEPLALTFSGSIVAQEAPRGISYRAVQVEGNRHGADLVINQQER